MVDIVNFFEILLAAFTAGLVATGILDWISSENPVKSTESLKESTNNLTKATETLGRFQLRPLLGITNVISNLVENPRPIMGEDPRSYTTTSFHIKRHDIIVQHYFDNNNDRDETRWNLSFLI